jgi:hypothetical protein
MFEQLGYRSLWPILVLAPWFVIGVAYLLAAMADASKQMRTRIRWSIVCAPVAEKRSECDGNSPGFRAAWARALIVRACSAWRLPNGRDQRRVG